MSSNERFIREQIRKILYESSSTLLVENQFGDYASSSDLYKTFIGPFVNVFKVAKTAFQDVTSATINTLRHSFTFNEDKRKELRRLFKEDRAKYQGRYAEAMKDVDATLGSGDAQLLAFMFNPGVYVGAQMFKQAADLGEPVVDVAREKMGMLSKEIDQRLETGRTADNTTKGPLRGLLGDLNALFFGEGYNPQPLLEEEEKEPTTDTEDMTEQEFIEFMDGVFKDSEFGQQLQKDAENVITQKMAELEAIRTTVKTQMEALNQLVAADTLEEMVAPLGILKQEGVDLSAEIAQVEEAAKSAKDRLMAGNEEAQTMMDELRKTPGGKSIPQDASPKDFMPLLEKGIIATAFQGGVGDARQELLQGVMDFVADEMTPADLKELEKVSPMGKKYSDLIMNFAKELATL